MQYIYTADYTKNENKEWVGELRDNSTPATVITTQPHASILTCVREVYDLAETLAGGPVAVELGNVRHE